jgi:hypothetical protein
MEHLVRFVGGPLHNKMRRCSLKRLSIDVFVGPEEPIHLIRPEMTAVKPDIKLITYELKKLGYRDTLFFEYHARGEEEETEHSGGDGTTASWRVDGHEVEMWMLAWVFRRWHVA